MAQILIIDDDEMFCGLLASAVTQDGYHVQSAFTLREGLSSVQSGAFDVVFLDVNLPDGNGLDILPDIREAPSSPEVIILTGLGTADGAELAIKSGVWDYIQKPSSLHKMILPLRRAIQYRDEKIKSKSRIGLKLDGIIGNSPNMKACYELIAQAAVADVNVLITGETGTGKELFARAVHMNSSRSSKNFVVVDCAALQDTLKESTLFGYEKGAFTGADKSREGLIKQADGGTLFLDEIGELPLLMQKSFLRVLQEHHFRPLGSVKETRSNFRLIAATNRNLEEMIRSGGFREDLLFRLRTLTIVLPPLREHPEDIADIACFHIDRICNRNGIAVKTISPDFLEALISYAWPGNVRELVNALERSVAASFSSPTLFQKHLPSAIRVKLAKAAVGDAPVAYASPVQVNDQHLPRLKDLREATYAQVEKNYLKQLMKITGGDLETACRISDVGRTRLYDLLKKHKIPVRS
ncbi:MAG: sigma-54-dependent Fis family transcriptional regulator [Syntrophaceae bacterium]|nr:sigma-54-dependent Fis family transcriptional regulator [Syntrophaceae bacterium]